MVFYSKYLLFIFFFAVVNSAIIPEQVLAEEKDYLTISMSLKGGTFGDFAIEETAKDESLVKIHENGTYKIQLISGKRIVSENYFEISDSTPLEVISRTENAGRQYGEFVSDYQNIFVSLILPESIESSNGSVKILKNGNLIIEKALSEIPINIISGEKFYIAQSVPSLFFLTFLNPERPLYLRIVVGSLILVLLILIVFWVYKRKKEKVNLA